MGLIPKFLVGVIFMCFAGELSAQPGYGGEWKKTRLYGHSYASGDFTDEQYDWIRDHFEYFTIEKTHLRSIYGNPSHELTSRLTATKLIEANPRCKPLMIYSIGSAYPGLFESEAEIIKTNPEYFTYDENGDPEGLNLENRGENDWYVKTLNLNTDSSDLHGIFVDGYKGTYTAHPEAVSYIMEKVNGFSLTNGMDFVPNGTSIRTWPESMENCDGLFIDAFFRRRVMTKEAGVVLLDACLEIPNDHMFVCFSAYDGYSPTHEFSHAAYLIVAHENTYYRWVDEGDNLWSSQSLMTWHDVFDKEMGEPLSKAVKTGYAYERVFKHCRVNINVETKTSSIEWDQNNTLATVEALELTSTKDTISTGESVQLSAVFSPLNATYKGMSWTSSENTIASVSQNGLVTAKKPGTVTITGTSSEAGITGIIKLTVKAISVQGISLEPSEIELMNGQTQRLSLTFSPNDAANKKVIWTSSDSTLASVSSGGVVTAQKVGTVFVIATSEDGGFADSCKVTINSTTGIYYNYLPTDKSGFRIYPNPANNRLYYETGEANTNVKIKIYSMAGHTILAQYVNINQEYIDISEIEKGMYFIQMSAKNVEGVESFVKY